MVLEPACMPFRISLLTLHLLRRCGVLLLRLIRAPLLKLICWLPSSWSDNPPMLASVVGSEPTKLELDALELKLRAVMITFGIDDPKERRSRLLLPKARAVRTRTRSVPTMSETASRLEEFKKPTNSL